MRYIKRLLILLDYTVINVTITAVLFYVHSKTHVSFLQLFLLSIMINLVWFFTTEVIGVYSSKSVKDLLIFIKRTGLALMVLLLLIVVFLFVFDFSFIKNILVFQFYIYFIVTIISIRGLYLVFYKLIHKQKGFVNRALIIGYNDTAKKLAGYLNGSTGALQLVGFVDESINIHELTFVPVFTGIKNTVKIAKRLNINEIFSTISPNENNAINDLIAESEKQCVRFRIVPSVSAFLEKGMTIDHYADLSMFSSRRDPLEDVGNRIKKRLFDVVISVFVIVFILSWLYPLLAILIKLSSKGPVVFKQLRSGISDQPFYCMKFRTMKLNNQSDQLQASRNDARVTWIGTILRKTSLDEFPQFINVLLGDMSVVGPRPHMLKHTAEFSQMTEHYMVRHLLKPGITGWAQVNSFRGEINHPDQLKDRISSDLWYLQNWSLMLDIKIVAMTFLRVFVGDKNAY
ncbi:MAG: exopolysaccharide biosynthesis polyprenyl glycosylphosphotransferase [Chitinophagaceae bacterium]|jgi:putative colanic acid biosynthesis UDP-glucose lipid carrier transferase